MKNIAILIVGSSALAIIVMIAFFLATFPTFIIVDPVLRVLGVPEFVRELIEVAASLYVLYLQWVFIPPWWERLTQRPAPAKSPLGDEPPR